MNQEQQEFSEGVWVASTTDPDRPQIALVKDVYELDGELLLDLVIYDRNGTRVGRESPACGGPRNFEPACPAAHWEPIEEPNFRYLAEPRYHWGDRIHRIRAGCEMDRGQVEQ